jgi:hypothetical protein
MGRWMGRTPPARSTYTASLVLSWHLRPRSGKLDCSENTFAASNCRHRDNRRRCLRSSPAGKFPAGGEAGRSGTFDDSGAPTHAPAGCDPPGDFPRSRERRHRGLSEPGSQRPRPCAPRGAPRGGANRQPSRVRERIRSRSSPGAGCRGLAHGSRVSCHVVAKLRPDRRRRPGAGGRLTS